MTIEHETHAADQRRPGPEVSTIGERIRAVRKRSGLGQDSFASSIGYTRRSLLAWETDTTAPPIAILSELRRKYDVDPEWVVLGEDLSPRSSFGPIDWTRYDQLASDIDAVCGDVAPGLPSANRTALVRALFTDADDRRADLCERVRGILLALSRMPGILPTVETRNHPSDLT